MAASTAFFGTFRGIKDIISQIIDIDSQLVVLKRVSNGQIDVNNALREGVSLADQLGNKLENVMESMIGYSRQGFRGEELFKLTEYATLMANVSELSGEESMSALTAATMAFKMEAQDAIKVVDQFNEIDNNFSTTTQILANSMMKSAGAANTFGVSLESLAGHTTAISQVTRESGNIIGKIVADVKSLLMDLEALT